VTIATETLAEIARDRIGVVGANDAARTSFTARVGDSVTALDPDLKALGQWPVDPRHRGYHATSPDRGLALISGPDGVRLLDHTGRGRWHYPHPPWTGAFESGCTWFDQAGQPYAVVPATSYDHCLLVCLDLDSGQPLAEAPIEAQPAGIVPVHHPDGWVGLAEGEGQDASRTWWVRSASQLAGQMRIEILDGGWDDWILSDVDPTGTKIITTPHGSLETSLVVRSFPSLEIVRSVDPPPGEFWDSTALFAGDMIITALLGPQERFVAIGRSSRIADLDEREGGYLVPAAHGTWLTVTSTTIRRRKMARTDEEIPGQMHLW
jgi:hypothetical protein